MSDLYYRGVRVSTNTTLYELYLEWQKTGSRQTVEIEVVGSDGKVTKKRVPAKPLAKEKLDAHFDEIDNEFKARYPNYQPYPPEQKEVKNGSSDCIAKV